ncbi:hypothetical protein [Streptomyces sp. NPDC058572]|uniref:hypothetical protein n=1 Tax=Streptomyces sp. NPDC058572 TaxID=3346546 RepID=UPI00364E0A7A
MNDDDQTGVGRQERICRGIARRLGATVDQRLVSVDKTGRRGSATDSGRGATPCSMPHGPKTSATLHGQANQRDLANPDDRFFLRIEDAHACRSSDDTSRRLKDALTDRAQDGEPHTGRRRYGYDRSGTAIIAAEAEIVREIFSRHLDGETTAAIAVDLHRREDFLFNAVIIDEPSTKGRHFGFGRVDIIEARCLNRGLLHISDER